MTVAIVSCVYGDHARFINRWANGLKRLNPRPDEVYVLADKPYRIPGAQVIAADCTWQHPQAFYLNEAMQWITTEWAWQLDIDDIPHANALKGLATVPADVWQMGFDRSDGERYVPPQLTNDEYLASDTNVYVGGSAVRADAFWKVGGMPDVALQDWALWRRMAAAGMTFQTSGRTHFLYQRHPDTRGEVELTADARAAHLAEMMEAELAAV